MPKVLDEVIYKNKRYIAQQKSIESKRVLREAVKFRSYVLDFENKDKVEKSETVREKVEPRCTEISEASTQLLKSSQNTPRARSKQERPRSNIISSNMLSLSNIDVRPETRLENERK